MKEYNTIRELYFTDEFWTFYHQQQDNVKYKFDYVFDIIRKDNKKKWRKKQEQRVAILHV